MCFSISSSSLEESSPEQTVPRSCIPPQPPQPLTTHPLPHPSSLHHHHKGQSIPAFMPVADLTDIHMTDSENSDFAEHSEMSDLGKHGLGEHSAQSGGFTPIHPDRVWPWHYLKQRCLTLKNGLGNMSIHSLYRTFLHVNLYKSTFLTLPTSYIWYDLTFSVMSQCRVYKRQVSETLIKARKTYCSSHGNNGRNKVKE